MHTLFEIPPLTEGAMEQSTITPTQLGTETEPAPPVKDRATRRAMGQRNPKLRGGLARLGAVSRKVAGYVETGPQRAERRAAARGLTVGAPVRANIGVGDPPPNRLTHPKRRTAPKVGPEGATPLDFGQRVERYRRQTGRREMTDAQYRRARAKASHASAPFGHRVGEWSA
jgi:hypothetical protein